MTAFTFRVDPVLQALDAVLVDGSRESYGYMGASNVGEPCERKLWYGFRRASSERIGPKGLRAIADGHRGEKAMADKLAALPFLTLWAAEPDGTQYGAKLFGGHFKCYVDGVVKGLPQSPTKPHVWEHKVVNEKGFNELVRAIFKHGPQHALKEWRELYYGQAQVSMHVLDLDRHYLTVESAGSRDMVSLRTYRKKMEAQAYVDKAERIVFAAEPPDRVSERPAYFGCRWCMHSETCHQRLPPRVTCRTCAHVTPMRDGTWRCEFHEKTLEGSEPCDAHRYIPSVLNLERAQVDGGKQHLAVGYVLDDGRHIWNSSRREPGHWTSEELREYLPLGAVADEGFNTLRDAFITPPPSTPAKRAKPGIR